LPGYEEPFLKIQDGRGGRHFGEKKGTYFWNAVKYLNKFGKQA